MLSFQNGLILVVAIAGLTWLAENLRLGIDDPVAAAIVTPLSPAQADFASKCQGSVSTVRETLGQGNSLAERGFVHGFCRCAALELAETIPSESEYDLLGAIMTAEAEGVRAGRRHSQIRTQMAVAAGQRGLSVDDATAALKRLAAATTACQSI